MGTGDCAIANLHSFLLVNYTLKPLLRLWDRHLYPLIIFGAIISEV